MGGKKPAAPKIVRGIPPRDSRPGLIGGVVDSTRRALIEREKTNMPKGSLAEDARTGNLPNIPINPRRPKYGAELIPDSKRIPSPPQRKPNDMRLVPKETYRDDPGSGRRRRRGRKRFAGRRRMPPASSPLMFDPADTLGPSPEREVPLPPEYRERITRESDPRGPAPFMPRDERRRDRFFEERADRRAERRSDRKDRREEFMNEINVGREQRAMQREEKRDIARSRKEERRMRRDENRGRRGNRRNFRRRRSRMERRRSRRERAAFRDRFVSTLRR